MAITNITCLYKTWHTGFWSCWIKSSTLTLMVGLKSSANNNQCFSIQSNRILGQFCSSPITANLVCCDWLKIRTYPKIISATINSRRPNTCVGLKFDFTSSRVFSTNFWGLLIPILDTPFFRSRVTKTVPYKNWECCEPIC